MPSYTFKCVGCSFQKMLSMPITEAPGIGVRLTLDEPDQKCPKCDSATFERVWGKTSAPFRFNMRRTPV